MFNLIFTVTVKSELTGRSGSVTIQADPNPDEMLEKFYEATRKCLYQIAGEKNGKDDGDSYSG
jgi:hypothetical protein